MQFAWHLHHDVLVEPLLYPIENRVNYIRDHKPQVEQELRLRLLRRVKGQLPEAVIQAAEVVASAWKKYVRAEAVYNTYAYDYTRALEVHQQAWRRAGYSRASSRCRLGEVAFARACEAAKLEILALHAKECPDCPWDGTTIFPVRS